MRMRMVMTAAATAMTLALAGCSGQGGSPLAGDGVGALGATVRVNPNPAAPWAAYFTIQGGKDAHVVTRVTVDGAERAEIHESKMEGGVMTMVPIERLEIPAREQVVLRSGGKHIMLFGVTDTARQSGHMTVTLHFEGGSDLPVALAFDPAAAGAATPETTSNAAAPAGEHSGH